MARINGTNTASFEAGFLVTPSKVADAAFDWAPAAPNAPKPIARPAAKAIRPDAIIKTPQNKVKR